MLVDKAGDLDSSPAEECSLFHRTQMPITFRDKKTAQVEAWVHHGCVVQSSVV